MKRSFKPSQSQTSLVSVEQQKKKQLQDLQKEKEELLAREQGLLSAIAKIEDDVMSKVQHSHRLCPRTNQLSICSNIAL